MKTNTKNNKKTNQELITKINNTNTQSINKHTKNIIMSSPLSSKKQ